MGTQSQAFNMGSKLSLSGKPPQNPPSKYPPPYENYVEDADYEKSNTFEQQQEVDDFLMNAQICQEIDYSEQQQQGCGNPFGRCGCSLQPVLFPAAAVSPNAKTTAVVVTIRDSSSYDEMFTAVPQEGPEGTKVAVYQTASDNLGPILQGLKGEPLYPAAQALTPDQEQCQDMVRQLVADIELVDNDCVVFNWECCAGVGDQGFPVRTRAKALELMAYLLQRGSMVMASDFSLKALIADWDEGLLGPNPFVKIGTFSQSFKLHFDAADLAACPSSQLQKVGELCGDKGHAVVSAMSDTIAYTVDPAKTRHDAYTVKVLTIVTEMSNCRLDKMLPEAMRCEVGAKYGSAGHVALTYPSGGTLLTSAGHWLELVNLDVSMDNLRMAYAKEYGASRAETMMSDLTSQGDSVEVRQEKMQSYAKMLVQTSAPCSKRVSCKYSA